MRKYYDTRSEANKAKQEREKQGVRGLRVWKMPKGTRHAGEYAVCGIIEYLNTY